MSMIERKKSFQPTGKAGWPICLLPDWRGGAASIEPPSVPTHWWHEDALLACDFLNGRFMRGGVEVTAGEMLTTTRASNIILPDSMGIPQTLGINALPLTTRGLFANGQITNSIRYSEDLTPGAWTKDAVTLSPFHYRYLTKIIEDTSTAIHGLRTSSTIPMVEGEVRRVSFDVRAAGRDVMAVGSYGSLEIGPSLKVNLTDGTFTGGTDAKVTSLGDGIFRVETSGVGTGAGIGSIVIRAGEGVYAGDGVSGILIGRVQMNAGDAAPLYVPTSGGATTALASDIRAVQGIRPSNGQPEPVPGWEAAGLDAGFTLLVHHQGRFRGAASRHLAGIIAANGFCRIETATNGLQLCVVGNNGTDNASQAYGNLLNGPMRSAFTILADGSVSFASSATGIVYIGYIPYLSAPQTFSIGSTTGINSWNDWVYGLQLCNPCADAKLLAWVSP